jgi:hypothetical protein
LRILINFLSGTVGGTSTALSALTVPSGGTVAPGDVSLPSGTLLVGTLTVGTATVTQDVTFSSGGTLSIDISGTSSDTLAVNGNLTLTSGAILDLTSPTGGSSPVNGQQYTISTFTGTLTGTFTSVGGTPLTEGTQFTDATFPGVTFEIHYNTVVANAIVLVALVPEPASIAMLGSVAVGAVGLGWWRRRKKARAAGSPR